MLYIILAFGAGLALALQAPINAALSASAFKSPVFGAFISFFIGTVCLAIIAFLSSKLTSAHLKSLAHLEYWKFLGGILGAFVVFTTTLCAPKIGLAPLVIFLLIGQFVMSLTLDSIGAFGLIPKPISLEKIIGLIVIIIGVCIFFYKDLLKA